MDLKDGTETELVTLEEAHRRVQRTLEAEAIFERRIAALEAKIK